MTNPKKRSEMCESDCHKLASLGLGKSGTLISIINKVMQIAQTPSVKNVNLSN
jgi:hypothetical protein